MKNKSQLINLILVSLFINTTNVFAQWSTNGSNIYNTNSGNVGIGTSTPGFKLDVTGSIRSNNNFRLDGPSGFTHSEMQFYWKFRLK